MKTRTQTTLAAICETSRQSIAVWQQRDDWPGDGANVAKLKRYAAERKKSAVASITGENADLKRRKLERQIELLTHQATRSEIEATKADFEYRRDRGAFIEERVHMQHLIGVVEVCKAFMAQTIQNVAAKRRDAELLAELKQARDRALDHVRNTYFPDKETSNNETATI